MKYFRSGLLWLFVFCVVIRIGAWLVTPVLPLVAILLGLVFILSLIFGGPKRLS